MLHDSKNRNTIGYRFSIFSLFCSEHGKTHVMTNCQEPHSCNSSEPEVEEVIRMDMFSPFFFIDCEDHQIHFLFAFVI